MFLQPSIIFNKYFLVYHVNSFNFFYPLNYMFSDYSHSHNLYKILVALFLLVCAIFATYIFQLYMLCVHVCSVTQSCPTRSLMDCKPTRLLCPWNFSSQEYWSRLPFPAQGSSQPRDQTWVSYIAGGFFATVLPAINPV